MKAHVLALSVLLAAFSVAHHGPEEVVADLTEKLANRPDDPNLLSRRATEYRVLGKHAEAEADLRRVLAIRPESSADTESLARVLWSRHNRSEAMHTVRQAAELAKPGRERGAVMMLQAEWAFAQGGNVTAMKACREAFAEDPKGMVDWYLLRSRIESRLGNHRKSLAGLKTGHEALGSVVLRNAWIDAALDAGEFAGLAPVIDAELENARLKSAWWIRRGRLRLGTGKKETGEEDLKVAMVELNRRIHPTTPDAKLLIDRGWARLLLGDTKGALEDLTLAEKHGADPWEVERLAEQMAGSGKDPASPNRIPQ